MISQKQRLHTYCLAIVCLFTGLGCHVVTAAPQSYNTSHESIASYEVPTWYSQGKLGVFMHLSAFSVPAHRSEWYASNMYSTENSSKA